MATPKDTARIVEGVIDCVARWPTRLEGEDVVEFEPGEAFAGMLWDGESLSLPSPDQSAPTPLRATEAELLLEAIGECGALSATKFALVKAAFAQKRGS